MKKKILYTLLFVLIAIHFLFLHSFGIAFFTTTILFYYLIYLLLKYISRFIRNEQFRLVFQRNIQVFILICLMIEFSMLFIFKMNNNYMENEKRVFFSEYKRSSQIKLLHFLGWKEAKVAWKDGFVPNSKRNHTSADFNYSIQLNQLGLRGELPPVTKDSNEFRIVVIGDSFTEGFGTDDKHTFPELLKTKLRNTDKKISVINGGISGSNPKFETDLYKTKLRLYNPDLILMEINQTDIEDFYKAEMQHKFVLKDYFYACSHIFRVLDEIAESIFTPSKQNLKNKEYTEKIAEHLKIFKDEIEQEDKQLLIIILPIVTQVFDKKPVPLLQAAKIARVPYIDLQPLYRTYMANNPDSIYVYYWKKDTHHTSRGYEMMAELTAQSLIEKQYISVK